MKEVVINGLSLVEFENDKIYQNRQNTFIWAIASLIVAGITVMAYVLQNSIRDIWNSQYIWIYILFFTYLVSFPLGNILGYRWNVAKRPSEQKLSPDKVRKIFDAQQRHIRQCKEQGDIRVPIEKGLVNAITYAIVIIVMLFILGLSDISNYFVYMRVWAYHIGYMAPSTLFMWVGIYYLIDNYNLMKKEYDEKPAQYILDIRADRIREQRKTEEQTNSDKSKQLIEQCGMKFFIKYYYRISRLPLRDVEVTENYTPQERMERLTAAKELIDSGLTEFALNQILIGYCDMLDEVEIATVNKILSELRGDVETKC